MVNEVLTVYGRAGCHLCEAMEQELAALQPEWGFSVRVVDVGSDPELGARYGHLVPVLVAGEREICHYFLDEAALARYLSGG